MIHPETSGVERLVLRPPNWLGDAVLALPAMAAVRRHFPQPDMPAPAFPYAIGV